MSVTFESLLGFLLNVFDKLKDIGATIVELWSKTLEEIINDSALANVNWLSNITEWIADNTGFLDVTLGGIVLGSIGLIILITLIKWFLGIIPFV